MNPDRLETAARIIGANRYMSLGTSGRSGSWVAPLAYTIEPNFDLVFYSAVESLHCQNIATDNRVSGAIFDSREPSDTADGLQFSGRAKIVDDLDLATVMARYFELSFPDPAVRARWTRDPADFREGAQQRFYRVVLDAVFTLDLDSTKIDRRVSLDLEDLKKAYRKIQV